MRDTELYRQLLGLDTPWTVARVELNVKEQRVDVWAEHRTGARFRCPQCEAELSVYDHAPERSWRHLDSCQFMTYLHARPPRVDCPKHGVKQARLPWAEPMSRFTALFERMAIDVLRETDVDGGARLLRISWDEAWHILDRAVERGLASKEKRPVGYLGIDEKSIAKGQKYFTVVIDLMGARVEYVGEDRRAETLDAFFAQLSPEQLAAIKAVAIDMWEPYIKSIREHVPGADEKIVFDRFHIMQHMVKAVDTVRKKEHRELMSDGEDTLARSKYLWLYSHENLPEKHVARFEELRAADLKTSRAWAIKESLRHLWAYERSGWAMRYWSRWYFWATHSRLKPIIDTAKMIQRHISNIMTYFKHRITNAASEGMNSKIQAVKQMARGFRNKEHFKTAIYFHCGGLNLYPALSGTH